MRNATTLALLLATAVLAVTSSSRNTDRKTVQERTEGCQVGDPAGWSDAMTSYPVPGDLATPCAPPLPSDRAHDPMLRTVSSAPALEAAGDASHGGFAQADARTLGKAVQPAR